MHTTQVFKSGNSQAIRIPKRWRQGHFSFHPLYVPNSGLIRKIFDTHYFRHPFGEALFFQRIGFGLVAFAPNTGCRIIQLTFCKD
jgi:hypothetical protein